MTTGLLGTILKLKAKMNLTLFTFIYVGESGMSYVAIFYGV